MKTTRQLGVLKGNPECLGPCVKHDGIQFTAVIPDDKEASLVLTDRQGNVLTEIGLPAEDRIGDAASVYVKGANPDKVWYYYSVDGVKTVDPYCMGIENDLCRVSSGRFDWGTETFRAVPVDEMLIYKLHVRGFTMKASIPQKKRGTFAGVKERLGYIEELGFNTIELMPVYAFDDTLEATPYTEVKAAVDEVNGLEITPEVKHNYWGYAAKNFYYAPNPRYAAGSNPEEELKSLVKACHEKGISVVLEFCFPERTIPSEAVRVLRYWMMNYRIDGFHLIGAGVPVETIAADPFLSRTYLFFERVWDALTEGKGRRERHILEYNSDFQNIGRSLLKGDEGKAGIFAQYLKRNPSTHGCVNYMANVNGFTLCDSVSYDWKHNEENGEANRDGTDLNLSWNCGMEGPSKKKSVRMLRVRQMKNALAYVFLSQGVPLLMAGDECMNSQGGNNNAYASDDETGWVTWNKTKEAEEIRAFVRQMIGIRKAHPILHAKKELKSTDRRSCGYPEISFHDTKAWMFSLENAARTLAVLYCGRYTQEELPAEDDFIYVTYNAVWDIHPFALPALPKDYVWEKVVDTFAELTEDDRIEEEQKFCDAEPRSVCIYLGRRIN